MTKVAGTSAGAGSGHRWTVAGMCLVLTVLLIGFAGLIRHYEADARGALSDRFDTRARLTASFAQDFVNDVAARERAQAERLLAGAEVDRLEFEQVVRSFDFEAAVLLDRSGRLLHVWPAKPDLIGKDMTIDYTHLRTAVAGQVGVSEMVPSAALGTPITAIAVPFDTVAGRRVLSGAFSPAATPLGAYLDSSVPVAGGSAHLLDHSGVILAGHTGSDSEHDTLGDLPLGISELVLDSQAMIAAVAEVPDSPWRVVLVAPATELYAPVATDQRAPWTLWIALAAFGSLAIVLFVRLGRARAHATTTAHTDSLTGLPNRRAMEEALHQSAATCSRHDVQLTALMIDIDHFKNINDTHGHDAGDQVLRAIAVVLAQTTRTGDIAGRWGGEEFLVLLPHTDDNAAFSVAERIRDIIVSTVRTPGRQSVAVTASIGVAVLRHNDPRTLMHEADAALYAAKANGRNRVEYCVHTPDEFDLHTTAYTTA